MVLNWRPLLPPRAGAMCARRFHLRRCSAPPAALLAPAHDQLGHWPGNSAIAATLRGQLRHQPVAVAAIYGAHELDHPTAVGGGRALEQEGRRVQRHAEVGRLLLVGDGGLDRLLAVRDDDAVALL